MATVWWFRALIFLLLVLTALPSAYSQTASRWLKLEQHSELLGNYDVYVSRDSLVLHTRESDITVVYKEPQDHITFFSRRTGKFAEVPISKGTFVNPFAKARTLLTGVTLSCIPMEAYKADSSELPVQLAKLNLGFFKNTQGFTLLQKKRRRNQELNSGAAKSCQSIILKDSPAGPKVLFMLARLQDLSQLPGLPVKVDYEEMGGGTRTYLKTFRVINIPDASKLLIIPTKLKKVRDPQAVMQDDAADDAMRLMILDSGRR